MPEYHRIGAYVCQPNRSFREGLTHLGFYADGAIKPHISRIRTHHHPVTFTHDQASQHRASGEAELADLIERVLDDGTRAEGASHDVPLLSRPDDPDTVQSPNPIRNDTTTTSARPWAWTLGQRYTRQELLQSGPTMTSPL